MLNAGGFAGMNSSDMNEPMLTPRAEYMPSAFFDNSFPLNGSELPNEWLSGSPPNNINGFPFPETFDVSPMSSRSLDQPHLPPQTSSRKTTIVLEDIEETTLSKVMNILIQEKAKVRMETTHSDRTADRR